jgi:Outer membrane protein beta-barrel domain
MRLRLALSAVVAFVSLMTLAPAASAQVEVGLKGGLNLGKTLVNPPETDTTFGFRSDLVGGLFISVAPKSKAGGLFEALYSRRGSRATDSTGGTPGHADLIWQYLDVNAMVQIAATPNGGVHIFIGPSYGVLLKGEVKDVDGMVGDVTDNLKKSDISVVVGAVAEFGHLVVDGRYAHGMNNIVKDEASDQIIKNRTVSFMLGVVF